MCIVRHRPVVLIVREGGVERRPRGGALDTVKASLSLYGMEATDIVDGKIIVVWGIADMWSEARGARVGRDGGDRCGRGEPYVPFRKEGGC